jgi:predicted RNA binding protein YcfA (HicA-like mRNA interferase family)
MSRDLPTLSPRKVIQALERAGFTLHRIKGSHHHLKHPNRPGLVTVPVHAKDIKRPVLASILKQAGLTIEEFIKLL